MLAARVGAGPAEYGQVTADLRAALVGAGASEDDMVDIICGGAAARWYGLDRS